MLLKWYCSGLVDGSLRFVACSGRHQGYEALPIVWGMNATCYLLLVTSATNVWSVHVMWNDGLD